MSTQSYTLIPVPAAQTAIADAFNSQVSFFINVPCFIYIAGWAIYVWNQDGRKWLTGKSTVAEQEAAACAGASLPVATVVTAGEKDSLDDDAKEEVEQVEKL